MKNEQPVSIEELALHERKFLHDIANHIVVAHGMLTLLQKSAETGKMVDEKDVERIEKALSAVSRMTALLKERRTALHSLNDKTV